MIIRYVNYYKKIVNLRYPKVKFSDYKKELKDGDIIFFMTRIHNPSNSIFTMFPFSHVGMVVIENGNLLISESTFGGYIDSDGSSHNFPHRSQLNDLDWRLDEYPGQAFVMSLKNKLSQEQLKKLHEIIHIQTKYPDNPTEIIKHLFDPGRADVSRHCMQHVNWLIDQIGLHPQDCECENPSKCYNCKQMFKKGLFKTSHQLESYIGQSMGPENNSYLPILQLIYDDF
jgi:hypothetical protein